MIAGVLDTLSRLAQPWGYLVVGLLTLLEASAFVGLVIPGETALLVGGFLAYQGRAGLVLMMLAGAVGAVAGDSVGYEIGRHLGPSLRRSRLGRRVGERRWERADAYLAERGGRAVFFGRFVGVLRAMVPTIAGLSRMPYRTFLPWNAAGGLIWAPGFVLLGYLEGGSFHQVSRWVGRASALLLVLVGITVALVTAARAAARHEQEVRAWARRQAERPVVATLGARFDRQFGFAARRLQPGGGLRAFRHHRAGSPGPGGVGVRGGGPGRGCSRRAGQRRRRIYRFFLAHRTHALVEVSRVATLLGSDAVLAALALLGGVVAWRRTHRSRDLILALSPSPAQPASTPRSRSSSNDLGPRLPRR